MDFANCLFKRMALGADAIDRPLIADETGTAFMTEAAAVDLRSVDRVNIQVYQSGRRMFGFELNAGFLDRDGIVIDPEDDVGTQQIAGFAFDGQIREMGRELVQHPEKKRLRAGRRLFRPRNVQRQEQRRRMPRAQGLSKGILAAVPRCQETTA